MESERKRRIRNTCEQHLANFLKKSVERKKILLLQKHYGRDVQKELDYEKQKIHEEIKRTRIYLDSLSKPAPPQIYYRVKQNPLPAFMKAKNLKKYLSERALPRQGLLTESEYFRTEEHQEVKLNDLAWVDYVGQEVQNMSCSLSEDVLSDRKQGRCACGGSMRLAQNNSILCCDQCPRTQPYVDTTSDSLNYGNEIKLARTDYDRRSHFKEWVTCWQALETTVVKEPFLDLICQYLVANRHEDPHMITMPLVKSAMKQLGLSKLYNHLTQVTCRLSGKTPPKLTLDELEILFELFDLFQRPFQMFKTDDRCNFFSYPYCFVQFCYILGWHHYIPGKKVLEGKDKEQWHDNVFEKCCNYLGINFTPTFVFNNQ